MEEYGTVKSSTVKTKTVKTKKLQTEQKQQAMVSFSEKREAQNAITGIKWYDCWNAEVYRNVCNKNSNGKFQAYMKINRNTTQTQKGKQKKN